MYNIFTLNKIAKIGLKELSSEVFACSDTIENPHGILVRSASMHDMEFSNNLLAIARAGAGVNNIPIEKCSKDGIVVFNTPGANANAVKELVILGLLISSRKIIEGIAFSQSLKGKNEEVPALVEKGKGQFVGPEIEGKTLGVIGLGAIGGLVANVAGKLGMKVIGYDPFMSVDSAWGISSDVKKAKSLSEIYENSDYITIHSPLNNETRSMINEQTISQMKDNVRILNFSRGELVCSKSIIKALESKKVACYVTDFPNDELLNIDGVIPIPHLGASTPESEDNCAIMACCEISDYLINGNIVNSVNFPEVNMPRCTSIRVCILHQNIPNVLSKISSTLGEQNINIENMINKSKKEFAYTILDVDSIPDEIEDAILKIEGVIRVRILK